MACYKSYIHFKFNTEPEESICVGMIMIDKETGESKAKLSDIKLKIASKILPNKGAFKLLKFSVVKLVDYDEITPDSMDRMHRYQNGVIKITKPSIIACSLDNFDSLFENLIERNFKNK